MFRHLIVITGLVLVTGACASADSDALACDAQALQEAVMKTNPPGVVDVIADGGFGCENGWAWAAMTGVMEDGDTTPTSTYVFRADGGAWTVPPRTEGRVAACGTLTAEQELLDVPPYPADAEIPESLWMDACWGN